MNKRNDESWFIPAGVLFLVFSIWLMALLPQGCCCVPTNRVVNVRVVSDVLVVEGIKTDPRFESSKILLPRNIVGPTLLSEPLNDALIIMLTTGHSYFITPNGKKYPKAFEVSEQMYKDIINWLRGNGVIIIKKKFTKRDIERTDHKLRYRKEK